jgi:hypothetical protein
MTEEKKALRALFIAVAGAGAVSAFLAFNPPENLVETPKCTDASTLDDQLLRCDR